MNEIFGILKDATNGNLPPSEWPWFILYLAGKAFWPLFAFAVIIGGAILLITN